MWVFWLVFFVLMAVVITLMYCCLIRASVVDDEMEKAFQQKMKLRKDEAEKCQEDEQEFFQDFSMEKYRQMISRMELTEDMKAKKLSSGMMAKLKIAVTMARAAKLYLLDEPLNGIDLLARDQIMRSILEAIDPDVTLVVSSHLVDELERVADAAIFMKDGALVKQCMVEELRNDLHKSVVDLYREIYGHGGEEVC